MLTERRTDDPAHFQGREFRADGPTVREGYKEAKQDADRTECIRKFPIK